MRARLSMGTLVLALLACAAGGTAHAVVPAGNVLVNPGAEDGAASADGGTVPVPGWVTESGFTAVVYGAPGFPPAPPGAGANVFAGGPGSPARAAQTVDLSAAAGEIDARRVDAVLSGLLGPRAGGRVAVEFFDAEGASLLRRGLSSLSGTAADALVPDRVRLPVPVRARSARVSMTASDSDGGYNDIYFDNLSLELIALRMPRPQQGRTIIVTPTKGIVRFERRGHRRPITGPTVVPIGSTVDTSRGAATVVSAADDHGFEINRGSFSQGLFAVTQVSGQPTVLAVGGSGSRECRRPILRRLASRTQDDFLVLAGRMATMAKSGPAAWVTVDRCTQTDVNVRSGDVDIADTGSRRTSGRRIRRRLFSGGSGRFRTRGRNSSATVRGRISLPDSPR